MEVLPLPRHAESAAADLVASSLGLGIPVLQIEGARTYAPGISTGAVAVFRAFSTPSPAPPWRGMSSVVVAERGLRSFTDICVFKIYLEFI